MNTSHIPIGNTPEDIEEAVETARLVMNLANKLMAPVYLGGTVMANAKLVALYAQIIDLRLRELRNQRQN